MTDTPSNACPHCGVEPACDCEEKPDPRGLCDRLGLPTGKSPRDGIAFWTDDRAEFPEN